MHPFSSHPVPFSIPTPTHLSSRLCSHYDNSFHFYLAKSINQLLRKKSYSPQVILFNDLQFLDQQDEFLKRYYRNEESPGRIELLANYFMKCRLLPEEMPCLISQSVRKYMFKRVKRYGKFKRRFEEEDKEDEEDVQFPELYEQYLYSMSSKEIEEESQSIELKKNISYGSSVHDIYDLREEEGKQKLNLKEGEIQSKKTKSKIQKRIFSIQHNQDQQEIEIKEPEGLVLDFSFKSIKIPSKIHLNLNHLPSYYQLTNSSKRQKEREHKQSYHHHRNSRNNLSNLSPSSKVQDIIGFYTGRDKYKQSERIKEMMQNRLMKQQVYYSSDPYISSERDLIDPSERNFKIKDKYKEKHRDRNIKDHIHTHMKTETIQKSRSENKEHEEYIKLLQKIGKKYNSPDSKKCVENNQIKKTSKFKPKEDRLGRLGSMDKLGSVGSGVGSIERLKQATSLNQNRLETLRYKAMKLIEDPRSMREIKSSDPTVRYK